MKVAAVIDKTHNPFGETRWVSCLRENLTSSSYGEGLETAEILDDEWKIKGRLHAVLLARLCAAWWPVDTVRARPRCAQALDEVTRAEQGETPEQRKQRIEFARVILETIGPLDDAMQQRLVDSLGTPSRDTDRIGRTGGVATAESLAHAADQDLATDRIIELISQALDLAPVGAVVAPLLMLRNSRPRPMNFSVAPSPTQNSRLTTTWLSLS